MSARERQHQDDDANQCDRHQRERRRCSVVHAHTSVDLRGHFRALNRAPNQWGMCGGSCFFEVEPGEVIHHYRDPVRTGRPERDGVAAWCRSGDAGQFTGRSPLDQWALPSPISCVANTGIGMRVIIWSPLATLDCYVEYARPGDRVVRLDRARFRGRGVTLCSSVDGFLPTRCSPAASA